MVKRAIEHFLLSEWIWSITWGSYQVPLAMFFMLVLIRLFVSMRMVPALLISFFAPIVAWIALSGFAYFMQFDYVIPLQFGPVNEQFLFACFTLGAIYTVLNGLFFVILNQCYVLNIVRFCAIALAAHMLAAYSTYLLLPFYYM